MTVLGSCAAGTEAPTLARAPGADPSTTLERIEPPLAPTTVVERATASPTQPAPPETSVASDAPAGVAVQSVTDGDTLRLADGRIVRLAQVDAPETGACFGSQATQALRRLVDGRTVTLRRPAKGPERDRYGRTVAEVSVADRSVNEQLVRDGAAEWYQEFANEDADLAGRLGSAEDEAKRAARGVWSGCPTAPTASTVPPRPAVAPSGRSCHPGYPGDCIPPGPPDLDCPDIGRKVRVDHSRGDPHRFDADRDGWGCESYG